MVFVCLCASSLTNEPPASLLPVTLSSHPSWQKGLQLPSLNIRYSDPCCDFLSPAGRDLSSVLTETRHFFSSATEESSNSHEAATKLGDKNTQPDSHPSQLDTMKTLLAKHLSGSNVREASSQVHIIFRGLLVSKGSRGLELTSKYIYPGYKKKTTTGFYKHEPH